MCDTTIDGREYDVCCAVANGIRDGKFNQTPPEKER